MKTDKERVELWNAAQVKARLKYAAKVKGRPRRVHKKRRKTRISKLTGQPIISRQKAERGLWTAFSLFVRKRDGACVMRDNPTHTCYGALQAGHVIGRTKLATKYHELNVHAQCQGGNYSHQYRPELYIAWFIRKHGAEKYLELTTISATPTKSLSTADCLRLTAHYQELTKQL